MKIKLGKEKETREQKFRRVHGIKKWGIDVTKDEFKELDYLVSKIGNGKSRHVVVLAALRKYLEEDGEQQ